MVIVRINIKIDSICKYFILYSMSTLHSPQKICFSMTLSMLLSSLFVCVHIWQNFQAFFISVRRLPV